MNRRPNLIPALVLIGLGLALGGYGGLQLRQAAARYQATAAVRVIRDQTDLAQLPDSFPAGLSDSVFLQNQAEVIRSEAVLNKVITKLDLTRAWSKTAGASEPLKTIEATERLRACVSVSQPPGSALLQLAAVGSDPAQAQTLANTLAAAFCEAREERRQQVIQATMDALAGPLRENEAKFQQATARMTKARAALDPAFRELDSPPQPTESDTLRELRQEAARLTMIVMVQSNQLARVQSLPAEELQKLAAQHGRATNHLNELEVAIQTEVQKQEALRNFWDAQQELDQVNIVFAPLQKAVTEQRHLAAATNHPPAIVAEPANAGIKLPVRHPVAFGCLLGAVGLLLIGAKLLGAGGPARADA